MKRYSVHLSPGRAEDLVGPRFSGRHASAPKALRHAQHIADFYGVVTQTVKDGTDIVATLTPPAPVGGTDFGQPDPTPDPAILKAQEVGKDHGETAVRWWWPENVREFAGSAEDFARKIQEALDGNEPNDTTSTELPSADLSGEWADSFSPTRLWQECYGFSYNDPPVGAPDNLPEMMSALCDAYEDSFSLAVNEALSSYINRELEPTPATDGTEAPA